MGKGVKAYAPCKSCLNNAKVRNYCTSFRKNASVARLFAGSFYWYSTAFRYVAASYWVGMDGRAMTPSGGDNNQSVVRTLLRSRWDPGSAAWLDTELLVCQHRLGCAR